jgi:hypothetical protein
LRTACGSAAREDSDSSAFPRKRPRRSPCVGGSWYEISATPAALFGALLGAVAAEISATSAALLGALIGAVAALVTAVLTNLGALRNERIRQEAAKRADYVQALRAQVGVAFTELFVLQHALNWVTWFAKHDPDALDDRMIASYDADTHRALPRILGAMAMVAALNLRVWRELWPVMQRVYDLEGLVAIELRQVSADRNAAIRALQEYLPKAYQLEKDLPPQLARIMEMAESEPRR